MSNEANKGWECPKCGRVYGPHVNECAGCNGDQPPAYYPVQPYTPWPAYPYITWPLVIDHDGHTTTTSGTEEVWAAISTQ